MMIEKARAGREEWVRGKHILTMKHKLFYILTIYFIISHGCTSIIFMDWQNRPESILRRP